MSPDWQDGLVPSLHGPARASGKFGGSYGASEINVSGGD